MKRLIVLFTAIFAVGTAAAAWAAGPDADWRAVVADAYSKSDLVMRGTVQSVDDQTHRDGGHVYGLLATEWFKGASREMVSIRAGGYFYLVPLAVDDSVLLFLKSAGGGPAAGARAPAGGPDYLLVEVATLTPMVFRASGAQAGPVDNRLQASFASVSAQEIEDFLSSIKQ